MLWRDVVGYEGHYQVSDTGLVRSLDRYDSLGRFRKGVIRTQQVQNSGYFVVIFKVNGKSKSIPVHMLVAKAFIPNPDNKPEVNHIDGNKLNNDVFNLEWATHSENMKHANESGLTTIVNRKRVKVTFKDGSVMTFKSQYAVSKYFGFSSDWCHQRIIRTGNPFIYNGNIVEVF